MNPLLIALIILAALFFIVVILIVIFAVPWRDIFVRKWGEDYRKGLAHVQENGKMRYRESELIFESIFACTYFRYDDKGEPVDDIVPHEIGLEFDEYTGRRLYRAFPGGSVCVSDDAERPPADFPSVLISADRLAAVADKLNKSVTMDGPGFPWKAAIIVLIVVALIGGALFGTGVIKLPAGAPAATQPAATQPAPGSSGPITEPAPTAPQGQNPAPGTSGPVFTPGN